MYIYLIRHKETGRSYVGQTTRSPKTRFRAHQTAAESEKWRHKQAISRAIHKHGWDSFDKEVLQECQSLEELNKAEIEWIEKLGTLSPNGYNLTTGGKNRGKASAETIEKMRAAQRGRRHSLESRKKLSLQKIGNDIGEEGRRKISQARKDNPNSEFIGCQRGRIRSEEFKENLSKMKAGENAPLTKLTWEIVREIRERYAQGGISQSKLGSEYGVSQQTILRIVRNQTWVIH